MSDRKPRKPFVASRPAGSPLGEPRLCQGCGGWHPAGTTCDRGWSPWKP